MKIGIIGSGHVGGNLGRLWAAAGHDVIFSSRHPQHLRGLIADVNHGAHAGTVREASQFGDIILFSPPFWMTDDALSGAGSLEGKIVIDATNPFLSDEYRMAMPFGTTAASELVRKIPKAHIVKAFNTLYFKTLADNHHLPLDRRFVVTYCGNEEHSKQKVAKLIEDAGFIAFDLGPLHNARLQEPQGPFFDRELTHEQADRILRSIGHPEQEAS